MIFVEARFFLFFLVCFSVRWLLGSRPSHKVWLLACSYFFYGCWDYRFLALILAITCIDYTVALALGRQQAPSLRRFTLVLSLAANLGILGFFKYYDFFVTSGTGLLQWLGVDLAPATLGIVLPVGISFITFQSLSYTIDVYRRHFEPQRSFLDFALFVAFFPQLVAGPIVRARDFLPQLRRAPRFIDVQGRRWLLLFLVGFFKKTCLADNIARAVDPVFASPGGYGAADVGLASVLYSAQIYCDFSGYSDMAIALAGLLGYRLTRNFDFPYFSRSIREFWQRWHISLSTWLRDYLYISLGGGRGTALETARNLMLTMLLGGLWHGANLTFVLWGFLHGCALLLHRTFTAARQRWRPSPGSRSGALLAWALTFAWVVFCFSLFRAPSLDAALLLWSRFGQTANEVRLNQDWWLLLVLLGCVHYLLYRRGPQLLARAEQLGDAAFFVSYGAVCAVVLYFTPVSAQPFIYFQF